MSPPPSRPVIRLRGVRHNNLKNFDLDLPQNRLIVVTGLSGSGKSSLAFDTLFAEGQRRYIETFSPYARQFFDRMDKPRVDRIEGIPPAIAIEQRNAVRTTRSTVGTMTEVCDYLKVLWPHLAQLHCRGCDRPVRKDTPQAIWRTLLAEVAHGEPGPDAGKPGPRPPAPECLITFDVPLSGKLSLAESLALVAKQGYQRVLVAGRVLRLDEIPASAPGLQDQLTLIQDRLRLAPASRARFIEACEQAYHFGKGRLAVRFLTTGAGPADSPVTTTEAPTAPAPRRFSSTFHCADCNLEYREPTPALFSFNHPVGACPACKGFGRIIRIDYDLALPDRSLTLAAGAVKPWRSGFSAECQADLAKFCRARGIALNVPFRDLPPDHQRWVIEGEPDYGIDADHQWPRCWYGLKGYFRWLESKAYKMHVRVLLSRYRAYTPCPDCGGRRLQPDALLWRVPLEASLTPEPAGGQPPAAAIDLAAFYALPIARALELLAPIAARHRPADGRPSPVDHALAEVRSRLGYLVEAGLGYLTLDRATRTLSGGETERVSLTTCLGSRLVNTLFVLDEPSVGLHPRDTGRLIRLLARLRDAGNTVVVVEHEASVMRAADQIVDLGPGHGETGGRVVFQGSFADLQRCPESLTGQYLGGQRRIPIPTRRPVAFPATPALRLTGVNRHNLHAVDVAIPLGRLVVVTGVSGSGKSTLIREVLFPELQERLGASPPTSVADAGTGEAAEGDEDASAGEGRAGRCDVTGWESLRHVVMVDQSTLGRTPRSNPAVYLGAFEDLRDLFAASEPARERGLNASAFSFNSGQGQCERCRGAGFEKIEMQFLSDVFIRCPDCDGRRYREHILAVRVQPPAPPTATGATPTSARGTAAPDTEPSPAPAWSIADVLDATAEDVRHWLDGFPGSRPAGRAAAKLQLLLDVGLGYLRLGQPINTLSGGESQRLKLAAHLAAALPAVAEPKNAARRPASGAAHATLESQPPAAAPPFRPTLFLFDEPTTGLHFEDVRVLLGVFQRLVDAGNTVLVIEHNLDVIQCADWLIDLGPEAGEAGGRVVGCGSPEAVAALPLSHTGNALREHGIGSTPAMTGAGAGPIPAGRSADRAKRVRVPSRPSAPPPPGR